MATLRTFLPTTAVLLASLATAGCQQPDLNCTSAHGGFAVKYTVKKSDADKPCGGLKGELVGAQTYFAEGGVNGTPKFSEPSLALRATYLYSYIYDLGLDAELDPIAIAPFDGPLPDDAGFCSVDKLSKVDMQLPEVPEIVAVEDDPATPDVDETVEGQAPQAATRLVYEWKNISFLVTADAQGTQFSADLVFTQDGCKAEYRATGLYPAIGCINDDGEPDDDLCTDDANGINPSFDVECEPNIGMCVLKGEPPAYE